MKPGDALNKLKLTNFLSNLQESIKNDLSSNPTILEVGDNFKVENLPIEARIWHKLDNAIAVVADLKNSTRLGINRHAASTANIYQTSTDNVVKIFKNFGADFIAIQGDGAFALFWGYLAYERALCTGVTIKTFSEALVEAFEKKWPEHFPETGLKVGISSSPLLAKRIGTPRNPAEQEPVWAGKAVNYAFKAAQQANRHELIITNSVWNKIKGNDYLSATCDCSTPSFSLWKDVEVVNLPDNEKQGKTLTSRWCATHGEEFVEKILNGEHIRASVRKIRVTQAKETSTRQTTARKRGLSS